METTIHDDELGTMTWNDRWDWWEGQVELSPGQLVRVSVSADDNDKSADTALAPGRAIILRLRERESEARLVAAEELLEIYNDEWNDDEPLSEEEFMGRLSLEDVSVAADGGAMLFYEDGQLFAGHTVVVTIGSDGNFADADIAG